MIDPGYTNIIQKLFLKLDTLLNSYVFHTYSALAAYLKIPLALAIVLSIVMLGISIMQGWVRLSMSHLVKVSIKFSMIYMAAINWGWFSHYAVDLINGGASQIGNVLIKSGAIPVPHATGSGINDAIQFVLTEFVEIGNWVWDKASWHSWSPCVTALLIWGFGGALILVAVFELVLAKIMLAILFATAPLFIGVTLFKPTQSLFDRWLGACVGFGLLMIFVSSMLALALSIAHWVIAGAYASHAARMSLVGFVPVMIVGFIGIGIILKAAQLAQGIGGTVTMASGSALLAGTIGGAIGGSMSVIKAPLTALKSAQRMLNSSSDTRRSKKDSAAIEAIRHHLIKSEAKQ